MFQPAWRELRPHIERVADRRAHAVHGPRLDALESQLQAQAKLIQELRRALYVPEPAAEPLPMDAPFMAYSNCQAQDFHHPRFASLMKLMGLAPQFHRKQWEYVYVLHKLIEADLLRPGMRGLGFGVGTEPLPAVFASFGVDVTATDAPMDADQVEEWGHTGQHSGSVEQLLRPYIAPDDLVRARLRHQVCDMNHIDPALTGFDFNWSCCCFEHLGTLEAGLDFVVNAVERTLRPGGLAVHTTEYNVSSNDETVTEGGTVIFRRRDIDALLQRLRDRGHEAQPFVIGPTAHRLDFHVDVPPYRQDVHLKLLLSGYVTTSVGIAVRRGPVAAPT